MDFVYSSLESGGDFNTDLDKCNDISGYINNFILNHWLLRCDTGF